jgi:hypothetical protein
MGSGRPNVHVLVGKEPIDQTENLAKAAVFLLLYSDQIPREWGDRPREVPPPALHDKRIQIGLGLLDDDGPEANQFYLALKEDNELFNNPHPPNYCACHELTALGRERAKKVLADVEAGRKPWGLDDLHPELAASATPAWLAAQQPTS